ncbi:hypothetical protein FA95DRAFT_407881 [Auriscalpium vulgare]|uniref:Uncharacterized protein n=1 Tax=Auriscalpium vulgare TaxID=40419 RepID=A0ACB8RIE1_9AGAM|nr:hypothetical protein FA95DRAFT_407881 [Auriscalpium vulgare]
MPAIVSRNYPRCEMCQETFNRPQDLKRHFQSADAHRGAARTLPAYACVPGCPKVYARKDVLRRHEKICPWYQEFGSGELKHESERVVTRPAENLQTKTPGALKRVWESNNSTSRPQRSQNIAWDESDDCNCSARNVQTSVATSERAVGYRAPARATELGGPS